VAKVLQRSVMLGRSGHSGLSARVSWQSVA